VNIKERVNKLRNLMSKKGVTAYIIPTADPHQSEYPADRYKSRAWISGFTGSAGTVVITLDKALLWTDGRYFIQAEDELKETGYDLMKMGVSGVPTYIQWLEDNLNKGDSIGFDGEVFSESSAEKLEKKLKDKDIKFISDYDLIDKIWSDRPDVPRSEAFIHEIKYTGLTSKEKIEKVRKYMEDKKANYFLIGGLDDIAWLYNIRGKDVANNPVVISYGIISKDKAYLCVDKDKINEEVKSFLQENSVKIKDYEEVDSFVKSIEEDSTILLDKRKINRRLYNGIPSECNIINQMDITTKLKGKKNETEIKNQKNAYIKDGVALVKFFHWIDQNIGKKEITEITASEKLEEFRREEDLFIEPSFDTISAYRANAAMAHYSAREDSYAVLEPKGMYLVDSGGQYLDGTTDITRTVALGKLTEEEKKDFTLTLKGHINLITAKFLEGTTGHQLDILCRYPLWQEGLDYNHGTGHGVGYVLNVHEGPHNIASVHNNVSMEKGMIVSIEPGVYKAGNHGIRIENIVVVDEDTKTESGQFLNFEVLSFVPIDLNCINPSLLDTKEKNWLNDYHKGVYKKLSQFLDEEERDWLKEETRSI